MSRQVANYAPIDSLKAWVKVICHTVSIQWPHQPYQQYSTLLKWIRFLFLPWCLITIQFLLPARHIILGVWPQGSYYLQGISFWVCDHKAPTTYKAYHSGSVTTRLLLSARHNILGLWPQGSYCLQGVTFWVCDHKAPTTCKAGSVTTRLLLSAWHNILGLWPQGSYYLQGITFQACDHKAPSACKCYTI